jgi:hypothetical protein
MSASKKPAAAPASTLLEEFFVPARLQLNIRPGLRSPVSRISHRKPIGRWRGR